MAARRDKDGPILNLKYTRPDAHLLTKKPAYLHCLHAFITSVRAALKTIELWEVVCMRKNVTMLFLCKNIWPTCHDTYRCIYNNVRLPQQKQPPGNDAAKMLNMQYIQTSLLRYEQK